MAVFSVFIIHFTPDKIDILLIFLSLLCKTSIPVYSSLLEKFLQDIQPAFLCDLLFILAPSD
jgi:hypothetical protein